jgi:hypothetical protein
MKIQNMSLVNDMAGNSIQLDEYSLEIGPYTFVSEEDAKTNEEL